MEIGHFAEMCEGYANKLKREDNRQLSLLQGLRIQAFFSLLPHAEKGFSFAKFTKEWPLPGDDVVKEEREKITTTPQQFAELRASMMQRLQKSRRLKNAGLRTAGTSERQQRRTRP